MCSRYSIEMCIEAGNHEKIIKFKKENLIGKKTIDGRNSDRNLYCILNIGIICIDKNIIIMDSEIFLFDK